MSKIGDLFEIRDGAEGVGDIARVCFMLILLTAIFLFGNYVGQMKKDAEWQSESVERGFAEYSQATGKWQWKESGDRKEQ